MVVHFFYFEAIKKKITSFSQLDLLTRITVLFDSPTEPVKRQGGNVLFLVLKLVRPLG